MCAWTKRQHRHSPRSLSTTFVDDGNSTAHHPAHAVADLRAPLNQTTAFDWFSGQKIHPGKVAGWAIGPELYQQVSTLLLNGQPLALQSQVKLAGPCMPQQS